MLGSNLSPAQKWPWDSGWAVSGFTVFAMKCSSITDKENALKIFFGVSLNPLLNSFFTIYSMSCFVSLDLQIAGGTLNQVI